MALIIKNLEKRVQAAVKEYWRVRDSSAKDQKKRGKIDIGGRTEITSGKTMDGFVLLVEQIIAENGLAGAVVEKRAGLKTLPGFFRPTKKWDLVISYDGILVAAIEFKSQAGPSIGKNF